MNVSCQPSKVSSLTTPCATVQSTLHDLLDVLVRLPLPQRVGPPTQVGNTMAEGEREIEIITRQTGSDNDAVIVTTFLKTSATREHSQTLIDLFFALATEFGRQ